jgi:hypothetical protein
MTNPVPPGQNLIFQEFLASFLFRGCLNSTFWYFQVTFFHFLPIIALTEWEGVYEEAARGISGD